MVKCSVWVPRG